MSGGGADKEGSSNLDRTRSRPISRPQDETSAPSAGPSSGEAERHDTAIVRALRELGRDLPGLFEIGRALCSGTDEAGVTYLIAHAGRELVRGVVIELEEDTPKTDSGLEPVNTLTQDIQQRVAETLGADVADRSVEDVTSAVLSVLRDRTPSGAAELEEIFKEDFRVRIGSALGLSPNDALVKRWFEVYRQFQRRAHRQSPAPAIGPTRQAFGDLAQLLFGLVGPIFDTETQLDVLAATKTPSKNDVERVRQLTARPVQRRHFFSRLTSADWIKPLADVGFFRHPPEREIFPDQTWRMRPWPEGSYLLRMIPLDADSVASILADVPSGLQNPEVWGVVADAIAALPPDLGRKLENMTGLASGSHVG